MRKLLALVLGLALVGPAIETFATDPKPNFIALTNLVLVDGFEDVSGGSPPPGWAMWGANEYKIPANYTREANNPHGGGACFRLHHPANSRGYIVSAPQRAIRPQPGMVYTVSFWARAAHAGKASFSWTAYQSINPFVDSPAPGALQFTVGDVWKEYSYSIREGLDLFADQSRFLLLTFTATSAPKQEQTLWIDDVRVAETPDPHPAGLLNEATIPHAALAHRLRPGERLAFSIDPGQRLRPTTGDAGGVSFHRVCGWTGQPYNRRGDYTLAPELERAIRELRLPMTRFYAVGDESFGLESAIDKAAEVCDRVGVAQEHCVLEFEEQGAATKLPPEIWARGVTHSLAKGYQFHHWEIANEPYSMLWSQGGAFPTPESFIAHFRAVSGAIRAVDPKARIGMDIHSEHVRWGNYLLKRLAGDYDFVAPHYYCGADVHKLPFEEIALTENYRMLDRALRLGALLRAYNPAREVYQYDTEWGMISGTSDGKDADFEDRNANIIGTLHRAVRLIYYAREDLLCGASGWQMLSRANAQGFGILSQDAPDRRFLLYWLYYYFNRHVGQWALAMEGAAPYYQPQRASDREKFSGPLTPTLATLSQDERQIYLVVANGSWTRAVPCRVELRHFPLARAGGTVITSADRDAKPLLERKEDAVSSLPMTIEAGAIACTIPPHAVVFLSLERRLN